MIKAIWFAIVGLGWWTFAGWFLYATIFVVDGDGWALAIARFWGGSVTLMCLVHGIRALLWARDLWEEWLCSRLRPHQKEVGMGEIEEGQNG